VRLPTEFPPHAFETQRCGIDGSLGRAMISFAAFHEE